MKKNEFKKMMKKENKAFKNASSNPQIAVIVELIVITRYDPNIQIDPQTVNQSVGNAASGIGFSRADIPEQEQSDPRFFELVPVLRVYR